MTTVVHDAVLGPADAQLGRPFAAASWTRWDVQLMERLLPRERPVVQAKLASGASGEVSDSYYY